MMKDENKITIKNTSNQQTDCFVPRNDELQEVLSLRGGTTKQSVSLIPKLRFKEFDGDWEETTLGNLFTFKNGLNSDKEKYGSGIKFINVLDIIGESVITYNSIIGKVEVTEKELEKNEVVYGDVLFQRSSETREEVGQANVYVDENKRAVFGGFVIRGRKKVDYNPYFMNYLLKTSSARKEVTTKSGGSTRYNVGQDSLSKVFVKLTSIPEQHKIASFLTSVDTKIQQLTTKKQLLENYKKGAMQQLFSQQLRFKPEDTNTNVIARTKDEAISNSKNAQTSFPDWEEKKLGEVSIITMGQSPDSKSYNEKGKGSFLIQGNADIKGRITSPRQWTNEPTKTCEIGDLILTVRAPVGSIAKSLHNACIGRGVCSIKNNKNSNIEFLYQFLLSYELKWISLEQGSTFTAVSGKDIKLLKISVPSLKEQQKIATYLSAIDTKIENVQTQIEKTQAFKKGLLQQMFV
ncbi:restriction endonuclease subunit S [Polaribacter sp. L3A8]|uniref:restriction endonuclease subunit S n=1 Tax=Polaribacter sp. L3A8 TaxID=2686361 RepID=UPI0018EEDB3A|nr:restriction endonuclease subunit S [Polaribacter sp. L3A8]